MVGDNPWQLSPGQMFKLEWVHRKMFNDQACFGHCTEIFPFFIMMASLNNLHKANSKRQIIQNKVCKANYTKEIEQFKFHKSNFIKQIVKIKVQIKLQKKR